MTEPHPYRTALEEGDAAALWETLHPEVSFHTPAWSDPIVGRDNVMLLFAKLAEVFEDPVIVDELEGQDTRAIFFKLEVDGHPIEGADYLELDGDGRVRRITVFMRPLASLEALANLMRETVGDLQRQPG
jgi:hypothetical protein